MSTQDLDENDLEPLDGPPAPPPSPRSLRGRVAFPIAGGERADAGARRPSPPSEELAVAGRPQVPARSAAPLPGQTERLANLQARRRRTATLALSAIGVLALVGAIVVVATRSSDREQPAALAEGRQSPPDQRPAMVLDGGSPDRTKLSPDTRGPDRTTRPVRVIRPVAPVARPAAPRPDAGQGAGSLAEAKSANQDGLRKLMQGETGEALRLFQEALQKQPRLSVAYRGLGLAYERLGSKDMARAAFDRYLLLQPNADDADAIRERIARLR